MVERLSEEEIPVLIKTLDGLSEFFYKYRDIETEAKSDKDGSGKKRTT